jgi:hypothetical protein
MLTSAAGPVTSAIPEENVKFAKVFDRKSGSNLEAALIVRPTCTSAVTARHGNEHSDTQLRPAKRLLCRLRHANSVRMATCSEQIASSSCRLPGMCHCQHTGQQTKEEREHYDATAACGSIYT